ncbi:MAG: hypothetical protein WA364_01045 [Candidatus Nitrosopolaris sp.]
MGKNSILSSILLSSILILSCVAGVSTAYIGFVKNVHAQNGGTWYLGKGAQPNTYYTYNLQEHDTKQGQPFTMTIYFKSYNNTGNYWIAPAYVSFQDKVSNATLHLSGLDLTPLNTANLSPDMRTFLSGYKDSLQWLSSFASKGYPQSLTAPYWGKIAAIGGSPVAPAGSATVTTPAGTFHTTLVTWHYGVDNNVYVEPTMPYPVKATTYAATTGGNPPIQYAFELQATGQGQPPVPKSTLYAPKPPITIQTARGTYYVELVAWQPPTITAGKPTQFGLLFKDSQQNALNGVIYSIKASQGGTTVAQQSDQQAQQGTGIATVTFPKPGPANLYVSVDSVAGVPSGEFVESVTFNLVVS